MAEFKTVMKEFQRLCSESRCENCPVGERIFNEGVTFCSEWIKNHPEEAERIITQWSSEHPIKTNGMKFEEVFGSCVEVIWHYEFNAFSKWADAEYKEVQE